MEEVVKLFSTAFEQIAGAVCIRETVEEPPQIFIQDGCNNQYSLICCQNKNCGNSLATTSPTMSMLFFPRLFLLQRPKEIGITWAKL
jgi:hypothetical protein